LSWGNNQFSNMSRNESPVTDASVKKKCTLHCLAGHRTENVDFWRVCACGCSVLQIWTLCTFTLPLIWNVASSQKMSPSTKSFSSVFNCISSQKSRLFTLSAGVSACTSRISYGLKHSRLHNTFQTVIFGVSNFLLALATDLRGLRRNATRTLSMLLSDTRGRPGLLPVHKHPVSTNCRCHLITLFLHGAYFLNRARNSRCTVITDLDTSKLSTQKAFSCCDAILETGPAAPQ